MSEISRATCAEKDGMFGAPRAFAFVAGMPIAAQLGTHAGEDGPEIAEIVQKAHTMAVEAVAYWQEQLSELHKRDTLK